MAAKSPSDSRAPEKAAGRILKELTDRVRQNEVLPRDFLKMVIKEVGGPTRMARIVAEILTDPKIAGVAKQRTLSDLMRLMQHVEVKSAPPPDLAGLPTEDLKAMLGQIIRETGDATQEAAATTDPPG